MQPAQNPQIERVTPGRAASHPGPWASGGTGQGSGAGQGGGGVVLTKIMTDKRALWVFIEPILMVEVTFQ